MRTASGSTRIACSIIRRIVPSSSRFPVLRGSSISPRPRCCRGTTCTECTLTKRRLVLDLAATSRNWALTPEAETRLIAATPPDWEVKVVHAPTSSDGDGPQAGSNEALQFIVDAEAY